MLKSRYIRKSPNGEETVVIIKTDEEVAYHEGLAKEGFIYSELKVAAPPEDSCASCSA